MKLGIRAAVKLAEGHALGILQSTDDGAFWGEDFFYDNVNDEAVQQVMSEARRIVQNRISRHPADFRRKHDPPMQAY